MSKHQVAIIGGTGDQGKGLALRWARSGFPIIIGSRDAARAGAVAEELAKGVAEGVAEGVAGRSLAALEGGAGGEVRIEGRSNAEAAAGASIIVLTVPFAAQIATLKSIGKSLAPGSVLIDVTVPLEPAVGGKPTRVLGVWAGSAAQQCAELAPEGVQVVSAFHNLGADALADLQHRIECDIIVCGDDKGAKERIRPLVEAIPGCRYVDGGALANSRTVEAMTALLIGINIRYRAHTGLRITGI